MTNMPLIDFAKVEALRKHMLLTKDNMAKLFSVSRMTYYSWIKSGTIRKTNAENVRGVLRELLALMSDGWPQPEIIALEPDQRFQRILELLGKQG